MLTERERLARKSWLAGLEMQALDMFGSKDPAEQFRFLTRTCGCRDHEYAWDVIADWMVSDQLHRSL